MLQAISSLLVQMFVNQNEFVAFIGAALFGTPFIILIASLGERAGISFWSILLFSFLGDTLAGYLWFTVGRNLGFFRKSGVRTKGLFRRSFQFLQRLLHENKFRAFALPHVLYGTKIISFFYFGKAGITPKTFLCYNVPFSAVWTTVLVALGWALGKGTMYVQSFIDSFILSLWITVLGCIALYLLVLWITHHIGKKMISSKQTLARRKPSLH
jgi:membrane protein DedA with SNARE-associated domain